MRYMRCIPIRLSRYSLMVKTSDDYSVGSGHGKRNRYIRSGSEHDLTGYMISGSDISDIISIKSS